MKISKIEVIPLTMPHYKPVKTSRGVWGTEFAYVRITTDNGIVGIGDAGHPKPTHYAETVEGMTGLIHNHIAPQLLGEDPMNIEKIIQKMDDIVCWNWIAKTGIDNALYDIVGKALNVPAYNLLGGLVYEKIPLGWLVVIDDRDKMAKEAKEAVDAGFHNVKIKVGLGKPTEDIENVRAIREAVGPKVPIQVDANQAWTPADAISTIKKLEKFDLLGVESPVPDWDIIGLAKVHHSVDVPIIADEAARSIEGAINVIRHDAADMFVLHISKAGGLFKCKQYLSIAEAAGMPVILGLMAGAGLENCANAHLGASTEWCGKANHHCFGPLQMFGGYDTKHIEEGNKDVIWGQPAKIEGGFLYVPKKPGLGAELNENQVKKFLTKGKEILVCEAK